MGGAARRATRKMGVRRLKKPKKKKPQRGWGLEAIDDGMVGKLFGVVDGEVDLGDGGGIDGVKRGVGRGRVAVELQTDGLVGCTDGGVPESDFEKVIGRAILGVEFKANLAFHGAPPCKLRAVGLE